MKGCAPDQAQRWAVQKKGVKEAGEETHLASQYWWTEDNLKPDKKTKKLCDFIDVVVSLKWIRTQRLQRVRRWPII